jgi:hypothetical protein
MSYQSHKILETRFLFFEFQQKGCTQLGKDPTLHSANCQLALRNISL